MTFRSVLGYVNEAFPGAWQRNITVDDRQTIMAFSAVFACVTRIASDIAKLRIKLVEPRDDGTFPEAVKNSPYWAVLRKPNRYQTRIQFMYEWMLMKLIYGNVYVLKERDDRGIVVSMYVLDSRRCQPMVTPDGSVYYQLSGDQLAGIASGGTFPASEIIHDRGATLWHPLCGVSPIYACGKTATQGNRIQSNSSKFFENMSRPSGHLTAPGTIDETTAKRLKDDFENNYGGGNLGRLFVSGDGLKYEPITIPANDAQLIEQLRWTVEDVARAFSMPLYKIGAGPVPTANNVQALQQQYYDDCLQINIEAIEACLDEGLGLSSIGYSTEMDLDGLLRMDSATQIDVLMKAVGNGIMTPNEARRKLGYSPIQGGDTVYLQQQNYSVSALDRRDNSEDPFGSGTTSQVEPQQDDEDEESAKAIAKQALDAVLSLTTDVKATAAGVNDVVVSAQKRHDDLRADFELMLERVVAGATESKAPEFDEAEFMAVLKKSFDEAALING